MAYDRFLIAPFSDGLRTDLQPWLIPEESFASLNNAYVWRGRVRKRFGGELMGNGASNPQTAPLLSRFRVSLGNTPVNTIVGNVSAPLNTIGLQFSVGDIIFTVYNTATGPQQMLRTDGLLAAATFDISNGNFNITGVVVAGLPFFYPGQPVMGLCNYASGPVNDHPSIGFDTQWAYEFTNGWDRIGAAQNVAFQGTDYDFFWTCNWTGITDAAVVLFVTNFNVAHPNGVPVGIDDPMWYYNATGTPAWAQFQPPFNNDGDFIFSAQIIMPFKDRLVLLNTIEQNSGKTANTAYPQRCRYSHNGSPLAANAFTQVNNTNFDGGGYIDASTDEAIISAEFIKDRLIVYFERSTWELAYTGNQVLPFVWQKINTELGAESVFSTVAFDKAVLGIGNSGVHACSGANVERIDTKIPDQIFQIANKNEGVQRVIGIRDYKVEMVYWTFPNTTLGALAHFPNQVLVYNYVTNSWAFNDDSITMFGYYEQQSGVTWSSLTMPWYQNNSTWTGGVQQAEFRQVMAGNQQGYTFLVNPDYAQNAPVLSITNITVSGAYLTLTIMNHNLQTVINTNGDYILLNNCEGVTGLDGIVFPVQVVIDANNIQIDIPADYAGIYEGGGNVQRISNIVIQTKQYNPYVDKGRDVYIAKIDFGVLATYDGEITIDYTPSTTALSMIEDGTATGAILGTSVLETHPYPNVPIERTASRLWHPVYFQTEGECIQFLMYFSPDQMTNVDISLEDFWLEGMVLHCMPTTSRLE